MTPQHSEQPEPTVSGRGDAILDQGSQSLRDHVDQRWVQISDRVRSRALRATRTSLPVRAQAATGPVHISEQVLITHLRDAISTVRHAKIQDVIITTDGIDTYTGVIITIQARFGAPLTSIADTIRDLASQELAQLLGRVAPPLSVKTVGVHIEDVFQDGDQA